MTKLNLKILVASLIVSMVVFGLSAVAFALTIPANEVNAPLLVLPTNNLHKISAAEINKLIDNNHPYLPDIYEKSWPPNPIEAPEDEIYSHTFDVSDTNWFLTKEATKWYLYYVGGQDKLAWGSNTKHALSSYASVPDASVMLLLGSSLMCLVVFSRKSKKNRMIP